jgi:putative oxidoreductase
MEEKSWGRCMDGLRGWGLTVLRIVVGIVFWMHGSQKLFQTGFAGVGRGFAGMGIPLPQVSAAVVTLVEFLGGLALVIGFAARGAAALLAIDMAVAVFAVHFKNGFFAPRGYEYPLTLLAANLCLVITGPGRAAIDRYLWRRAERKAARSTGQ